VFSNCCKLILRPPLRAPVYHDKPEALQLERKSLKKYCNLCPSDNLLPAWKLPAWLGRLSVHTLPGCSLICCLPVRLPAWLGRLSVHTLLGCPLICWPPSHVRLVGLFICPSGLLSCISYIMSAFFSFFHKLVYIC